MNLEANLQDTDLINRRAAIFKVNCLSHHYVDNCMVSQNKEGILPVATLSIALYVLHRSMSASDVAPEVTICHRLYKHQ